MTVAACIATRREAETIGPLVKSLVAQGWPVYVVDDSPDDRTASIARDLGAQVWRNTSRRGIGPSLRYAWEWALQDGCERLVQIDAGGSHNPHDARILAEMGAMYDVVLGSRFLPHSHYIGRPLRAIMSKLAALACNWRTGKHISDWTSGYRAFSKESVERLLRQDYRATMHGWHIEVLGRVLAGGMNVREVPITYIAGQSAFNWQIAREAVGVWWKLDI